MTTPRSMPDPPARLTVTRERARVLIEALARHEEYLDRLGCARDIRLARTMLAELGTRSVLDGQTGGAPV